MFLSLRNGVKSAFGKEIIIFVSHYPCTRHSEKLIKLTERKIIYLVLSEEFHAVGGGMVATSLSWAARNIPMERTNVMVIALALKASN